MVYVNECVCISRKIDKRNRSCLNFSAHPTLFIMGEVEHGVNNTPSRVFFTREELTSFDNEQFNLHWSKQEQYVNWIESQLAAAQAGISFLITRF